MVKAETKESGDVSWKVYGEYAAHIGVSCSLLIFTLGILAVLIVLGSEWWLSHWVSADEDDQRRQR